MVADLDTDAPTPLHPQESRPTPYWVVGRVQWIPSQYMCVLVTCKFQLGKFYLLTMLFVGVGTIWQIGLLTNCSSALDILISGRMAGFSGDLEQAARLRWRSLIAKRKTQSIFVYFSTSRIIASRLDPVSQSFTTVIKDKDSAGRK